jgi:heat shock protein HslJ
LREAGYHLGVRRLLLGLVPRTLIAAACGDDQSSEVPATDTPETASSQAATLDGRTFLSTEVTGHELIDGTIIQLGFADGSLSANAGCNQLFGGYRLDGDVLAADALGQTQMACEDALMEQDTWLSGLLTGSPTVILDADELTLTSADGATVVTMLDREVADPDRPLEGTRWVVESTISTDAVSSIPSGATASITITDGTVAVESGCNTGSGSVTVGEDALTFGPIATTTRACEDDLMSLESAVFATLVEEVTYAIEANVLTIRSGDAGLVLRADES